MPWLYCRKCGKRFFFPFGYLVQHRHEVEANARCRTCRGEGEE